MYLSYIEIFAEKRVEALQKWQLFPPEDGKLLSPLSRRLERPYGSYKVPQAEGFRDMLALYLSFLPRTFPRLSR